MTFNVVESVLSYVSDTSVRMHPHITLLRNNFTSKYFNHSRLTSTIFTDTANTGSHGNLNSNIKQSWFVISRVGKVTFAHLHKSSRTRFDTFDRSRLRETNIKKYNYVNLSLD